MQFYESEVNMTTGEKNELKKLQRKKEVRRQYEKIAITVGVIIVIIFAGKMIFGKKKSVPTAGNVETSQKQTQVEMCIRDRGCTIWTDRRRQNSNGNESI